MSQLLLFYVRPEPGTWVYLSIFLLVGVFFVFHRLWSVRNLDILLLILLTPGLLLVYEGRKVRRMSPRLIPASKVALSENPFDGRLTKRQFVSLNQDQPPTIIEPGTASAAKPPSSWTADQLEFAGFASLLLACGLLSIRMLIDPALVRRPLLEPNLSVGGLSFIGVSLFLFLMSNVITSDAELSHQRGPKLGPGYALLNRLPDLPTTPDHEVPVWNERGDDHSSSQWVYNLARALVIVANLAIVVGIIGIGYWHFDNVKTGIGCAAMYLLFPYTAQMAGNVEHALPAALLTLAILSYRQPLIAGAFLGLASGLVYYPLFLLPLWISFYMHRGLGRLLLGVTSMLISLACLLLLGGWPNFVVAIRDMFGLWIPAMDNLSGVWGYLNPMFRLPVLVAFILLSFSFIFWPPRKTLGTLMCGTAAIMLAAQFWHGFGGGLYMAWFLPSALLTIFRPNLDDRIASRVVSPNWSRSDRLSVTAN